MSTNVDAAAVGCGGQVDQGEGKQDKCEHPAPGCTSTCSILAPTHRAGSHCTNTNTTQDIYSLYNLPSTLLYGAEIHIIYAPQQGF